MKKFEVWKSKATGYLHAFPLGISHTPFKELGWELVGIINARSQFEADNKILFNKMPV